MEFWAHYLWAWVRLMWHCERGFLHPIDAWRVVAGCVEIGEMRSRATREEKETDR